MVRPDGTIDARELHDVAAVCGFTVNQIRFCLARLVQEGSFTQAGRGRQAVLTATAKGWRELEPEVDFVRLAWAQDAGRVRWCGAWHVVGFTIDEERRAARNALRAHIVRVFSGAPLAGGLYVSAHDWDRHIVTAAEELEVSDRLMILHTERLTLGGESDPAAIARRLWNLDGVAETWHVFLREHRPVVRSLGSARSRRDDPARALASLVRIAASFDHAMRIDPLLPPELLPPRWPGARARALLVEVNALIGELRDAAQIPALFRRFETVMAEVGRTAGPARRGHR